MNQRKKTIIPTDYESIFDYDCFISRLNKLLNENHVTQAQLATVLDIQPLQITRWKRKENKLPVKYQYICKIANTFHVDTEWLYNPKYERKNSAEVFNYNYKEEEDNFYAQNNCLISYLNSIGYDVDDSTGSASYNESNDKFDISHNYWVFKNGEPICKFDDNLKERIKHIVEYTMLS